MAERPKHREKAIKTWLPAPHFRRASLAFFLMPVFLLPGRTGASWIIDPKPPMSWDQMLACELVVLARLDKCKGKTVWLRVDHVLRGKKDLPKVVKVSLRHWFSAGSGPSGVTLYYKKQLSNPGKLTPVPVLIGRSSQAIYFLPKQGDPALTVRGQIQPAEQLGGWKQALAGKPLSLKFRLRQTVKRPLRRQALEELHRERDPAVLRWLVQELCKPRFQRDRDVEQAKHALVAIGDVRGDVYDAIHKRLLRKGEDAASISPNDPYDLPYVLARIDPPRALRHFEAILTSGPECLKPVVAVAIGYTGREEVLAISLRLLKDPKLAREAIRSLTVLLYPGTRAYQQRIPRRRLARLKTLAEPRIRAALASPDLPPAIRSQLRNSMSRDLPAALRTTLPKVDPAEAEKVLMNSKDKAYEGWRLNKDAGKLLDNMRQVCDPRLVPVLVKVACELPKATDTKSYTFRETFQQYARMCTRAMRRELDKRGKLPPFDEKYTGTPLTFLTRIRTVLQSPNGRNQFTQIYFSRAGPSWIARQKDTGPFVRTAGHAMDFVLKSNDPYPIITDLNILAELAPKTCLRYVDWLLARKDNLAESTDLPSIYAAGIRAGRAELLDDLIAAVRADLKQAPTNPSLAWRPRALLYTRNKKAEEEYLRILDGMDPKSPKLLFNMERPSHDYFLLLAHLFENHNRAFFPRMLAVLRSKSMAVRRKAAETLQRETLFCDFEFDHEALAARRAVQLAGIQRIFESLAGRSGIEIRAEILRRLDVKLPGKPGRSWLPALVDAAASYDPAVARNALLLIEDVTQEYGCEAFHYIPPDVRRRALAAFCRDRGLLPGPTRQ